MITGKGHHKSRLMQVSVGLHNITLHKQGPPYCPLECYMLHILASCGHIFINLKLFYTNATSYYSLMCKFMETAKNTSPINVLYYKCK